MSNPSKQKKFKTKKHLAREQREAKQTRIIIIIAVVVAALVLGLVIYGLVDHFILRANKPIAQVGEEPIKVKEFEKRVEYARIQTLNQSYQYYMMYQQFGVYGSSFLETAQNLATQLTQPIAFGSEILDDMINGIIIKEEAAARGITVSEEEIDEAVQAAFGFFPEGTNTPTITATIESTPTYSETQLALVTLTSTPTETATPTGTPAVTSTSPETKTEEEVIVSPTDETSTDLSASTPQTPTPELSPTITLTPTLFTTEVYGQNIKEFNTAYKSYNFSIDDLRELARVELLKNKLIEAITKDMVPVQEEVWARHILVGSQEEAEVVLNLLDKGFNFHNLAAQHSMDESNKENGGDLGWFDEEAMISEFADVAFSLEVGEISEPVETNYGFHIVQVLGKRETQTPPDKFKQEKQAAFEEWLGHQRNSRDDIVIYDEWEAYVSDKPEVPQQFLVELYQASAQ